MNPVIFEFMTLLILGLILVFVFVTYFVKKLRCPMENRYLSVLLLLFGFRILFEQFSLEPWYSHYDYNVWQSINFAFAPLVYIYLKTLTSKSPVENTTVAERIVPHFIAAMAVFLILLPFMIDRMIDNSKILSVLGLSEIDKTINEIIPVLNYLQVFIYYVIMLRLLLKYRKSLSDCENIQDIIRYRWIWMITAAGGLAWIVNGIKFFTLGTVYSHIAGLIFILIIFGAVLTAFYFFLNYPGIISGHSDIQNRYLKSHAGKYFKTRVPDSEVERIMQLVEQAMKKEKLQEGEEISLNSLAGRVGCEPYILSQVINRKTGGNFYNYINGYRIAYSKELLQNPEHASMTIPAIAFRSGFSSKSSFNEAFKKHTGMTPTQFRNKSLK